MKKYSLKLLDDDNKGHKARLINNTKNNISLLDARVKIKDNSIFISYSEDDFKKVGFLNIEKVEIYKGSSLICFNDKISNYHVEFPNFSSDGIYEIRTIISNKGGTIKRCLISSFEFFKYEKKFKCDNFKLYLTQSNNNLNIRFNKRVGDIDLSDIILPNISLMNSDGVDVGNISCKLNCTGSKINFVILDVFNDHKIKRLIPNEIYTLKIKVKGRDILKSFYFEYKSEDVCSYDIVDNLRFEFKENVYPNFKRGILYIKLNSLVNIEEYEYVLSNVKSKFLYFKSSLGDDKDTLVFECTLRDGEGYFELNMFNVSMITIVVDYNLLGEYNLWVRKYIDKLNIERNINKYNISFYYEGVNKSDIIELKKFLKEDIVSTRGEVESSFVYFKDTIILNKSSEIYFLTINSSIVGSFILSKSIGVVFKQNEYSSEVLSEKVSIKFLNEDCRMYGDVLYKNRQGKTLDIQDNSCLIDFYDNNLIYLKLLNEDNKTYYETICIYKEEREAYIRYYTPEKIYMDYRNNLILLDKNVLEDFGGDFDVQVMSHKLKRVYDTYLNNITTPRIVIPNVSIIEDNTYYIKIIKKNKYKIYSIFINPIIYDNNVFIEGVDNDGADIIIPNLTDDKDLNLEINLFVVVDKCVYTFIDKRVVKPEKRMRVKFSDNVLTENTEYLVNLKFSNGRESRIFFLYLGDKYFDNIEDNTYELNRALLIEYDDIEHDIYDFSFDRKIGGLSADPICEVSCDDIDIIIKKAFDVFLNIKISKFNREFILWKNLIRDNKVDLKYFIEIFMLEYIFRFRDDLDFIVMIKLMCTFLNIEDEGLFKSIDLSFEDPREFLNMGLSVILNTQGYRDMECVFKKNNEL